MKEIYISVDVEAAGPVPATYSMLSLGAVVVDDVKQTFYIELKPINDQFVPDAMKVVGKTLRHFAEKGPRSQRRDARVSSLACASAKEGKPVFVGFNATFDWAFVNFYFHHHLGENPFGFGGIDIKSYYMGMSGCTWDDTRSSRIRAISRARLRILITRLTMPSSRLRCSAG